jgi:hypothetical protein
MKQLLRELIVLLDGTDAYWATSRHVSEGAVPGCYHWMPYQLGQAAKAEALEQQMRDVGTCGESNAV